MIRRILVTLDGSPFAEQALPVAVGLAHLAKADLQLVQIHQCYAFKDPACSWGPYDPAAEAALKEEEKTYLERLRSRLGA